MTFLVEEVAFDKIVNPITDLKELDAMSTYLRSKNLKNEEELATARAVTQVALLAKMKNIGIDKFIEFRNDTGIKELRKAFNSSTCG